MLARMRFRGAILLAGGLALLTSCGAVDSAVTSPGADKLDAASTPDVTEVRTTPDILPPSTDIPPVDQTVGETVTTDVATTDVGPLSPEPVDTGADLPAIPAGEFPNDPNKPPQAYDAYLVAALDDIQTFWRTNMPAVYNTNYQELSGGVFPVYPGKRGVPGCGTPRTSWAEVQGNAFYCQEGDFVAYDDNDLLPQLDKELGRAVIGVVFAHEWGHAIQSRLGLLDGSVPTVTTELQADCFAGAWTAHLAAGESDKLHFTDAEIGQGLAGMISVADQPGITSETDIGAHGSAFARVGSFQDGFESGVKQCATYIDSPPNPMQFSYQSSDPNASIQDLENAPYDDTVLAAGDKCGRGIFQLIECGLTKYWPPVMESNGTPITPPTLLAYPADGPYPDCPGISQFKNNVFFCPSTNQVMYDDDLGRELYNRVGDFSIGYLVSDGWSEAIQNALGSKLGGEKRALLDDCLTGAFVRSTLPTTTDPNVPTTTEDPNALPGVSASPGDLDEAVKTAILVGDESSDANIVGSPFEKIDAFRVGVLSDLSGCQSRYAS